METLHWRLHRPKATPVWWGSSSRQKPLSTLLTRYNVNIRSDSCLVSICLLYVIVLTAHICSVTNAVCIHTHTYYRMGVLPSTLQHREDMRMLWSSCLMQRLTQNWKKRSLIYEHWVHYWVLGNFFLQADPELKEMIVVNIMTEAMNVLVMHNTCC